MPIRYSADASPIGERMTGILNFLTGGQPVTTQQRSSFTPNDNLIPEDEFNRIINQPAMPEPVEPMTAFDAYQMGGLMGNVAPQAEMPAEPFADMGGPDEPLSFGSITDPNQAARILNEQYGFNSMEEVGRAALQETETGQRTPEAQTGQGGGVLNILRNFLGNEETMANLAIAFNSMRLTPDPSLAAAMQSRVERIQEQRAVDTETNATANWLRSRGYNDLADLILQSPGSMKSVMDIVFKGMAPEEALTPKDKKQLANSYRSTMNSETNEDTERVRAWRIATNSLQSGDLSDFAVTTAMINWLNSMGAPTGRLANGNLQTESGAYQEFVRKYNELMGGGKLTRDQIDALMNTLNIGIEPVVTRLSAAETYWRDRFDELGVDFDPIQTTLYAGEPFAIVNNRPVFRSKIGQPSAAETAIPPAPAGIPSAEWPVIWAKMSEEEKNLFRGR